MSTHPALQDVPNFIGRRVRITNRIYAFRSEALVGKTGTVVNAEFYLHGCLAKLYVHLDSGETIGDMRYQELGFIEEG